MNGNYLPVCLCAVVLSVALLASCDKEVTETVEAPVLAVSSNSIVASADGGAYGFTYYVENSLDDGRVSCAANADWIFNLDYSVFGTVTFSTSANTDGGSRTAQIAVTYSSSFGVWSQTVVVAQNYGDAPQLVVQPTAVAAEVEGGVYSFNYSVVNPADDGEVSCSADVTWISGFDCSTTGVVAFSVDAGQEHVIRQGVITVSYTYAGGERNGTVTVVQNHLSGHVGGDGDVSNVVGTYTVSARVYDATSQTGLRDATWTMKVFEYTGDEAYNLYIDGWIVDYEGAYDNYGDHSFSLGAYYYSDGRIEIPAQVRIGTIIELYGADYNLGFTPIVEYDAAEGSVYWGTEYPPMTLTTQDSGLTYESDYGAMSVACASTAIWTMTYFTDFTVPTHKLTKVSSSTLSDGSPSAGGFALPMEDTAHSIPDVILLNGVND